MENALLSLRSCRLFADIAPDDLQTLLHCLAARRVICPKNSFILSAGDAAGHMGVVLSGSAQVMKEDFWGNRSILTHLCPGELFGESFSCAGIDRIPVNVVAVEKTEVLLVDYRKIFTTCTSACAFHNQLIRNMVKILADKNILLTQKMEHITQRTTREKLLSYLSSQAQRAGSNTFTIPFNRQELADYLSVDRSAMSGELGRMRDEGIVRFDRSLFRLADRRQI
ncbi:MAG: Crp/Fnr family transcriptional regulator [Eubacteriales bacterium]|nr:Crp/Fnr family transcriptional regulator [Eubacteriales bacterium]